MWIVSLLLVEYWESLKTGASFCVEYTKIMLQVYNDSFIEIKIGTSGNCDFFVDIFCPLPPLYFLHFIHCINQPVVTNVCGSVLCREQATKYVFLNFMFKPWQLSFDWIFTFSIIRIRMLVDFIWYLFSLFLLLVSPYFYHYLHVKNLWADLMFHPHATFILTVSFYSQLVIWSGFNSFSVSLLFRLKHF